MQAITLPGNTRPKSSFERYVTTICNTSETGKVCGVHRNGTRHKHRVARDAYDEVKGLIGRD